MTKPSGMPLYDCGYAKGYQRGRADALKPIPIENYDWSSTKAETILAFDKYGQAFLPCGMVKIKGVVYDAKGFNFNNQDFLKGKEIDFDFGRKGRVIPRKIKWFLLLPTAEQIKEQKDG